MNTAHVVTKKADRGIGFWVLIALCFPASLLYLAYDFYRRRKTGKTGTSTLSLGTKISLIVLAVGVVSWLGAAQFVGDTEAWISGLPAETTSDAIARTIADNGFIIVIGAVISLIINGVITRRKQSQASQEREEETLKLLRIQTSQKVGMLSNKPQEPKDDRNRTYTSPQIRQTDYTSPQIRQSEYFS